MNTPFGMRREAGFYYLAFLIYVNLCWLIRGSLFGVLLAHSVLLRFPFLLMFNEFIRCFHQFVSTNYFHEFFSIWAVEKENNFLLVQISFFFQFASFENSLKQFVDLEFKLVDTIWWIRYLIFFSLFFKAEESSSIYGFVNEKTGETVFSLMLPYLESMIDVCDTMIQRHSIYIRTVSS